MGLSIEAGQLQRYKEIVLLLWKYGQSDLSEAIGSEELFGSSRPTATVKPKLEELGADLAKLGPTFIKIGRVLSRRPDLLPLPYVEVLSRVEEHLDPMAAVQVEEVFEVETAVKVQNAFESFDFTPIKVGTFGQVHHAVLRGGQEVMVKVQRPGVYDQALQDFEVLSKVAQFCNNHTEYGKRFDFMGAFEQIQKSVLTELDYRQEAHNLKVLKANLKTLDLIVLPTPVDLYSTRGVFTMRYIQGQKVKDLSNSKLLMPERTKLAEQVFYAYLQQILVDGFVDAEPEAENILLTNDNKIALLDMGRVARISPMMQEKLLQVLLDIDKGKTEHLSDVILDIGQRRERFDEENLKIAISELVLRERDMAVENKGFGKILLGIAQAAAAQGITVPSEIAMLGTALLNMHNVARMLDPRFDSRAYLQRVIPEMTRNRMLQTLTPVNLFHNAMEAADLLEKLPSKVGKILDSVADNRLKVTVHAIDEQVLISGFQKIANRITVGLVVAALIIGASMLMRVPTGFSILGYPGFAMLCFIVAAGFGCVLVLEIMISDRRAH